MFDPGLVVLSSGLWKDGQKVLFDLFDIIIVLNQHGCLPVFVICPEPGQVQSVFNDSLCERSCRLQCVANAARARNRVGFAYASLRILELPLSLPFLSASRLNLDPRKLLFLVSRQFEANPKVQNRVKRDPP